MTPDEQTRYSRQTLLPGFGERAQEALKQSRVLIVGLGGLGSPVAMYLAAAGIGRLLLADFDAVDLSNLQRQILHNSERVGWTKVDSAVATLSALNPCCELVPIKRSLSPRRLGELAAEVDLIVDASDNFQTRYAVNAACIKAGIPLVSGAAIRAEGQVAVFSGRPGDPCYQCLYPDDGQEGERCAREGVLAPLVGIIGSIQATEAIKVLSGYGEPLFSKLLLLDAQNMAIRMLAIPPDPACPICADSSAR
ncbi:molybdopterin-synthase adenylyltransferase MoeB [Lamprobacter modestohalophilus]|uniref:HesA/MoeB/ThiF family protein n=1 Tax=Lamprobacter modestohalophilus TaxID=1064514 RepID=UPI002ADEE1CD|nr:molybdopterin-synthase adenylyltransferase MoeB [Lamprobacter modestohalophilus]MEA1049641.1 molybdopterin-synthase adenylyltransferase MoeB [Lamprobacter modestohalophilus]